MKNLNLQTKSNNPYLIRKLLVMMFLALLWVANVRAEYGSGWVFTIQGDGTACANYPVSDVWTPVYNGYNEYMYDNHSYARRILSSVNIPASVTKETVVWDGAQGKYVKQYGATYSVTAFMGDGYSAEQKAAVTSATIPSYITTLARYAFYGFASLTEITIPETVTTMGSDVFFGNAGMKKATVLNSMINANQFNNCTSLEEVILSNNLTTINGGAFSNCSSLKGISIPASVTSWGSCFGGCNSLQDVSVAAKVIPGQMFSGRPVVTLNLTGVEEIGASAFEGCKKLRTVTTSSSLTTIGRYAFYNCELLEEITIPETVTTMGSDVFYGNAGMKKATVLNSVINASQFNGCTSLEEVILSNNLTTINGGAFNNCSSLKGISIPASVTSWGSCFGGCNSLQDVSVSAKVIPSQMFSGRPVVNLNLTGVEEIGASAFEGCKKLKTVTTSSSLTTIGRYAFYGCELLEEITIPASVTTIASDVFFGNAGMKKATVLNSLINGNQFSGCTSLEEVILSNNLTTINGGAFNNCSSLKGIAIPASVTSWGSCFGGCNSLQDVSVSAKVIPSQMFSGRPVVNLNLTGVEEIGASAFESCKSLTHIILSASLRVIGNYGFYNCSAMQELTVGWQMPLPPYNSSTGAGYGNSVFYGVPTGNVTLNVPPGTESLYKAADVWKNFNIRIGVTGISLSNEYLALKVDSTYRLTATVVPENANNKEITWSSSNTGVATVSAEGLVTGMAPGTAIITVTTGEGGFSDACTVTVASNTVAVTGISLNRESLALKVDSTAQLTAAVQPGNATDQSVTWSSDKTGIATVSPAGLVTGITPGAAVITATTGDGGFSISCAVTVTANPVPEIHVTGVALDKTSIELKASSTAQLTATVQPANAGNQSVTWSSSNEAAATVSREGLVIALAAGSATITVTTGDGGFTATCEVTVTPDTDAFTIAPSTLAAAPGSKEGSPVMLTLTLKAGNENIPVEAGAKLTVTAAGLDFSNVSLPNGYTAVTKQNGKLVFSFNASATLTGAGTAIELAGIVPAGTTSGTVVINLEREGQAALTKTFAELTFAPLTIDDFELALSLSSDHWTAPVSGILATPVTVTATVLSKATGQTAVHIAGTLKMSLTGNAYVSLNGYSSLDITIANGQGTVTVTKINAYVRFGEALQYKLFAGGELAKTSGSESSGTLSAEKPVTLTTQTRYLTGRIGIDRDGDFNPANDAPFSNALVTLTVPEHTATIDGKTVAHPEMNISARTDAQGNYSIALPTPHEGCGDDLQQATLTVSGDETRHVSERTVPVAAASSGTAEEPVVNFSATKYVQFEFFIYNHPAALEEVTDLPAARSDEMRVTNDNLYTAYLSFRDGKTAYLFNYTHVADNVWHIPQSVLRQGTANGSNPAEIVILQKAGLFDTNLNGTNRTVNYSEAANDYNIVVDIAQRGFVEILNSGDEQSNTKGIAARIFYRPQGGSVWSNAGIYYAQPGQRITYGQFTEPTEIAVIMVENLALPAISSNSYTNYWNAATGSWSVPQVDASSYIVKQKTLTYGTKLSISEAAPPFDATYSTLLPNKVQANFLGVKGNTASVAISITAGDNSDLELGHILMAIDNGLIVNLQEASSYSVLPDGRKVIIDRTSYNQGLGLWTGHSQGIIINGGYFTKMNKGETLATVVTFDLTRPEETEALHHIDFLYQPYVYGKILISEHLPIASVSFTATPNLTLEGQNYTEKNYIAVSGKAAPDAEVALFVDEVRVKTVKANKAGQWTAEVPLFGGKALKDIASGEQSVITATSGTRTSEPLAVSFAPSLPSVLAMGDMPRKTLLIAPATVTPAIRESLQITGQDWKINDGKQSIIMRYTPGEALEYRVMFNKGNDFISSVYVNLGNASNGGEYTMPAEYDETNQVWIARGELPATGFAVGTISVDYLLKLSGEIVIAMDTVFNIPLMDEEMHIEIAKNVLKEVNNTEESVSSMTWDDLLKKFYECIPELANAVISENPVTGKFNISSNIEDDYLEYTDCYLEYPDLNDPRNNADFNALLASENAIPYGKNGLYNDRVVISYTKNGAVFSLGKEEFLNWVSGYESFSAWATANGVDDKLQFDITQAIRIAIDESMPVSLSSLRKSGPDYIGYGKKGYKYSAVGLDYLIKNKGTKNTVEKYLEGKFWGNKLIAAVDIFSLGKKWQNATSMRDANLALQAQKKRIDNLMNSDCGAYVGDSFKKEWDAMKLIFDDMADKGWKYTNSNAAIQITQMGFTANSLPSKFGKQSVEDFLKKKVGLEVVVPDLATWATTSFFDAKNDIKGYDNQMKALKNWTSMMKNYEASLYPRLKKKCQEFLDTDERLKRNRFVVTPTMMKSSYDPSGFAYEDGDLTKFVSDVHAEVWQADDASGANARPWNEAVEYGEVNPQTTGVDGWYAWDVPIGWWQVRLSKEGYEDAHSEWLRVIPPQLGINLEMKRSGTGILLPAGSGNTLSVYPNPTKGELRIANYELRKGDKVTVASLTGQTVAAYTWPFAVVDISYLPAGIYIVTVEGGNGISRAKVVKQ